MSWVKNRINSSQFLCRSISLRCFKINIQFPVHMIILKTLRDVALDTTALLTTEAPGNEAAVMLCMEMCYCQFTAKDQQALLLFLELVLKQILSSEPFQPFLRALFSKLASFLCSQGTQLFSFRFCPHVTSHHFPFLPNPLHLAQTCSHVCMPPHTHTGTHIQTYTSICFVPTSEHWISSHMI